MNRFDFNLNLLRTFRMVAEAGSFSAAAERLDLSQPAVSLQIKQLERHMGVGLIERIGRRVQPTAAGQRMLHHAEQIEAAVAHAVEDMARQGQRGAGRVRLGTGATACAFLLPGVLRDLRLRCPDLEITVSTGNAADIGRAIEDNLLDVGLVTLPVRGRMLEISEVLDDDFVAIFPAGAPAPERVGPADLAVAPLLLFEPGGNTRLIANRWLRQGGVAPASVMSLGSVEAIKELVASGMGCSLVPGMAVREPRDRDRMQVRELAPGLSRKLAIVMRRDKPLQGGLRETIGAIRRAAGTGQ